MIKLQQDTQTGSDCTAGYKLILDKECTLIEFINEILESRGFGHININNNQYSYKYSNHKLVPELNENIANKKVIPIYASGGYGLMDYIIKI